MQPNVSYYSIILGDLRLLIDMFIDCSPAELMEVKRCKEIVIRFDKLKGDYAIKLQGNEKTHCLTSDNIEYLNQIFSFMRYILTRFGRVINFLDVFEMYLEKR